jgi:hypothetical protein
VLASSADIGGRWVRVEQRSEIAVTEAVEELASVEGGCEESSVVGREGIEAGDAFVADMRPRLRRSSSTTAWWVG